MRRYSSFEASASGFMAYRKHLNPDKEMPAVGTGSGVPFRVRFEEIVAEFKAEPLPPRIKGDGPVPLFVVFPHRRLYP